MNLERVVVAGGGAAGFFAGITCAQARPDREVVILEKSPQFLSKVRISGGGRCNVTSGCFDPRELAKSYPRGARELLAAFHRFQAKDTFDWFQSRGVKLKIEPDGRAFPASDSSATIIDCLVGEARRANVRMVSNRGVEKAVRSDAGFALGLSNGETLACSRLLLATGGCRAAALGALPVSLGHTLEPPVPSLFTLHAGAAWVRALAGVSVPAIEVSAPGTSLRARGAILFTHWGLSGPAVLRLSAWGARELHSLDYKFPLVIDWLPDRNEEQVREDLSRLAKAEPARLVSNRTLTPLPSRLWEALLGNSGIADSTRWAALSRAARHDLVAAIKRCRVEISGKSLNKDEFVTCGGVRLKEINFRTMESRICPRLYFAGELLDIDGLTGGYNFQAAWTTGWLAGQAMALD